MWVDIDDLRADLERLYRKYEEELRGEEDMNYRRMLYGILVGYRKVEMILDEQEEAYRKHESEYLKCLREESEESNECEWIKYDSWTICPKYHDANSPYWRIPENTDKLKYCPYCGKKITIVKEEENEE